MLNYYFLLASFLCQTKNSNGIWNFWIQFIACVIISCVPSTFDEFCSLVMRQIQIKIIFCFYFLFTIIHDDLVKFSLYTFDPVFSLIFLSHSVASSRTRVWANGSQTNTKWTPLICGTDTQISSQHCCYDDHKYGDTDQNTNLFLQFLFGVCFRIEANQCV